MHVRRIDFRLQPSEMSSWDVLLGESQFRSAFLTSNWLEEWSRFAAAPHKGYALVVHNREGRLIGAAPLVLRESGYLGLRELRFMGTGAAGADHLDFISVPGERRHVIDAVCDYLGVHSDGWDVLRLSDIPEDSLTPQLLQRHFRDDYVCVQTAGAVCPYLPLTGSWESFLSRRSANFRQQTRSKRRKFEKLPGARFVACDDLTKVERALRCLFRFNPDRCFAGGNRSTFEDPLFQEFHINLAAQFFLQGWLDLYCLEIGGEIVAVIYGFAYGQKIYFYNSGFNPRYSNYSPGRVLQAFHIQSAFERGFDEYDFLRGLHSYKLAWTSHQRTNIDVLILRRSAQSLARYHVHRGMKIVGRALKRHLPRHVGRPGPATSPAVT